MPPLTFVHRFTRERFGRAARAELTPLRGGLDARGISRAVARVNGKVVGSFVAKPFEDAGAAELQAHWRLESSGLGRLAPELLGWRRRKRGDGWLFLEWVRPDGRWPWKELEASSLVVSQLAELHNRSRAAAYSRGSGSYDAELIRSAESTLEAYRAAVASGMRPGRPMARRVERIVSDLPRLRRQLAAFDGVALLHGDAHPGNVVMRKRTPVLLDWGRSRVGSPLEDMASWIHSLAFWEPEARRRHDTLLRRYRDARGQESRRLTATFRDAVVLAGACNALSGALRYHLVAALDEGRPGRERVNSYCAATDWLRILRRAGDVMGLSHGRSRQATRMADNGRRDVAAPAAR